MSDTVSCIGCERFSVKRAPEWCQEQGYGCCERHPPFLLFAATRKRDCGYFTPAGSDVVTKRTAWIKACLARFKHAGEGPLEQTHGDVP
jgi:hypothetical protein